MMIFSGDVFQSRWMILLCITLMIGFHSDEGFFFTQLFSVKMMAYHLEYLNHNTLYLNYLLPSIKMTMIKLDHQASTIM